jgi:hypothetical protein
MVIRELLIWMHAIRFHGFRSISKSLEFKPGAEKNRIEAGEGSIGEIHGPHELYLI